MICHGWSRMLICMVLELLQDVEICVFQLKTLLLAY